MINTKEVFFMSYMSISIYIIYYFLFIIMYIVRIMIVSLYYIFVLAKQSREINRTNYFDQYLCYRTCDNASVKFIMIWFVRSVL